MEPRKLQHNQQQKQEETLAGNQQQEVNAAQTFENVEDLLRHDAKQVTPPASIEQRLAETTRKEKPRSWFRKLFGK